MTHHRFTRVGQFSATIAICVLTSPLQASDGYTVSVAPNIREFAVPSGESRSTVVGAGKKSQCPNGRIFITDEGRHPPLKPDVIAGSQGIVHWRNLAGTTMPVGASAGQSLFSAPPQVKVPSSGIVRERLWFFGSSDHNLLTLPNGDLIYQSQTFTREPLEPRPDWFARTFRNRQPPAEPFGPGARTTLAIWRSVDCGQTFQYLTEINSYGKGYEECGNPQPARPATPIIVPPPDPFEVRFDMGGTDGPSLVLDRINSRVYSIFRCVGNLLVKDSSNRVALSPDQVSKTYVFSTKTNGSAFTNRGAYSPDLWGPAAVPLSGNQLAVGIGSSILVGKLQPNGRFDFSSKPNAVDDASFGWTSGLSLPPITPPATGLADRIKAWLASNTLMARLPHKTQMVLLAFPTMVEQTKGKPETETRGYRLYAFDPTINVFVAELDPIIPKGPPDTSAIMHLTAIDPVEGGPILVYWYDLDGSANSAQIRGRVITGPFANPYELDVARINSAPAPFNLTLPKYWFGDYKSAGGFRNPKAGTSTFDTPVFTYHYYPMWVQPPQTPGAAGTVNYTEVTVTQTVGLNVPSFVEKLTKLPDMQVFGECCDFVPLIRGVEARLGLPAVQEQRSVSTRHKPASRPNALRIVADLLAADPNLRDDRLRIAARPAAKLAPPRTVSQSLGRSDAVIDAYKKHEEERGPDRK